MSKTFLTSLLIVIFALLAAMPSVYAREFPVAEPLDPRPRRNAEEVGAALERWRLRHDVPGLAVVIFNADGRQLWLKGRRNAKDPVTADTVFQGGQLANLLTAMALQTLVTEGSLSPDAKVRDLVPEVDLHNPWSEERPDEGQIDEGQIHNEQPVLVRHLLSHQAGISPLHFRDLFTGGEEQPLLAGLNSSFRALRLEYPPGTRQVYSQASYGLAAYLVERGSEPGYSRSIDTLLPGIGLRPSADAPRARNERSLPAGMHATLGEAANVELDIRTLAALGQLLLRRGEHDGVQILRRETIAALEEQLLAYLPSYTAGGLRLEPFHGRKYFVAAGANPGHIARLAYDPELRQGYAVLVNGELVPAALGELENFLRGQLHIVPGGSEQSLPPPRHALAQAGDFGFSAYWRRLHDTPVERFLGAWLDVAQAVVIGNEAGNKTGSKVAWRPLLGEASEWRMFAGGLLREAGAWWPERMLRGNMLLSADARWRAIPGWQYYGGLLAGLLVTFSWLATLAYARIWILASIHGRVHGYHEWLPRLLPLLAQLALLVFLILLLRLDIPEIGRPVPLTYAVLIASILQPLLALASLPAALAGVYWKLGWRSGLLNIAGSVGALASAVWLIACGLFAFQSWNY